VFHGLKAESNVICPNEESWIPIQQPSATDQKHSIEDAKHAAAFLSDGPRSKITVG
jgi:hypothetical protein